jgi:hypothetical protein
MSARRHAATVALFVLLAIAHTWPLTTAPARWSRVDNGDYALNAWILAWVVHQAPRDPLHLFDANIFYPEPRTLAFSEHLVPQAMVAAPVLWAGGSAVLAYNVVLLAGFVLTAWSMAWVIARWTGDWPAGIMAGALFAFNAHTLTRLTHVQALHNEFLPLALLALDEVLVRGTWPSAARLGIYSALHGLTSGYSLVFGGLTNIAAALARAGEWLPIAATAGSRAVLWSRTLRLTAAAIIAAAVLAPFLIPYWEARRQQGLTRSIGEVTAYSATGVEYVATAGRLYMQTPLKWGYTEGGGTDTLFPGLIATLLSLGTIVTGLAWRDPRARMCLAIGIAGLFFSLGPKTPVYAWLYAHVPLLQGIRAPVRFGFLALMAVAALAGFGLAWARRELVARTHIGPRSLGLATAVVFLLGQAEALRAPLGWRLYRPVSPVYRVVAQLPHAVIAEFPFYQPSDFYRNADYMLASTIHWKPLLNGYSGFMPDSYRRMAEAMRRFPDPPTTDLLRMAGVTHVIIHRNRFGAGRDLLLQRMDTGGEFQRMTGDEQVRLYRLLPRPSP